MIPIHSLMPAMFQLGSFVGLGLFVFRNLGRSDWSARRIGWSMAIHVAIGASCGIGAGMLLSHWGLT